MAGWHTPVDLYCERTDASFWAEPINAVTNGAFLLASLLLVLEIVRSGVRDRACLALALLVGVIGLGSFAFHTIATRFTAVLDVVPIGVFIFGYLALALHRFVGLGRVAIVVGLAAFAGVSAALPSALPAAFPRGLAGYLPALLAMIAIGSGLALGQKARHAGRAILFAGALFAVSLTFRTLDLPLCEALPFGTHFMWHLLNATVLWVLVRAAIAQASTKTLLRAER